MAKKGVLQNRGTFVVPGGGAKDPSATKVSKGGDLRSRPSKNGGKT